MIGGYEENLSRLKRQKTTVCNFTEAVWEGFSAEVTFELRMKDKRSRLLGCLGVGWGASSREQSRCKGRCGGQLLLAV